MNSDKSLGLKGKKRAKAGGIGERVREFNQTFCRLMGPLKAIHEAKYITRETHFNPFVVMILVVTICCGLNVWSTSEIHM